MKMSISTNQPSPQELLAGIKAVADYIGPRCALNVRIAMLGEAAAAVATDPKQILAADMTLRDYFAGQAMARIVAADKDGCMGPDITAQASYRLADRMLAARGAA
jgi:hypothetical protein